MWLVIMIMKGNSKMLMKENVGHFVFKIIFTNSIGLEFINILSRKISLRSIARKI